MSATATVEDGLELSQVFCLMADDNALWNLSKRGEQVVWENFNGGIHFFNTDGRTIFRANGWDELEDINVASRILETLDSNLDYGLISPEGEYYGVERWESDFICSHAFGFDRSELLDEGWIVIQDDCWLKPHGYTIMTDPQNEMLERIGRSVEDEDYRNKSIQYSGAFTDGNKIMDDMIKYQQSIIDTFIAERKIPTATVMKLVSK